VSRLHHGFRRDPGRGLSPAVGRCYCEYVPNVTVSLDEDVYRRARVRAAERNTSVSALVRAFLNDLGSGETDFERRRRLQDQVLASIGRFRARDRLGRDEVHERAVR
jgi:plasmid stability protein